MTECPRCGYPHDPDNEIAESYLDPEGIHIVLYVCPKCGKCYEVEE